MTRGPDPKAKTLRLTMVAKDNQREKLEAFKELCQRNNLHISDVLWEKVEDFLKKHHWPPGNSQTVLDVYDVKAVISNPQCGILGCSKPATYELFHELMKVYRCKTHKHFQLPWKTYGSAPIKRV